MFELSPNIDKNKIFLVNHSEIEGRLDPYYYSHPFINIKKLLIKNNYINFRKIIKSLTNGYDYRNYSKSGTPYIKVANIKKGFFDFSKLQFVNFNSSEISKKIQLKKGNILLTRKGSFGIALALDKDYNYVISSEIFYIEIDNNIINPKFLEIFFNSNIGQQQFDQNKIGAIMGSLSQEVVNNLIIPLPPKEIQQKIINLYETAYKEKQQKEAKAERLLNSIDDYLLGELGITLPEKDNSLENRIFKVNFSEVTGRRFDPKLYDNYTKALKEAIDSSIYDKISLKKLIVHSISGDWGIDEKDNPNENYIKCLVIRATEFDNIFNLNLENSRVKYRYIHKIKYKKMDIQPNDLLIEKSGGSPDQPVGRVSIITKEIIENHTVGFSNFIHKIRVNEELINPEYLFYYLKTLHNIKLTDAMQSQTNGIRNLIMNDYYNLNIALPETEKQNEIAEHIKTIKDQAKQLKAEAKEVLEQAKQEVEKMILGE